MTFSHPSLGRWRSLALLAALLGFAFFGSAAGAADATRAAGFIVDTGDGEPVYVVVTFAESMTAVDLLREADLGAVTVDFGGLGEAVCEIRATGCDVSTCRQRLCQTGDPESPFWQYWRQDEEGWTLSPLGASDVEPGDGDIGAWVWIGTRPELDPIVWDDLAERAGAPEAVVAGEVAGNPMVYTSAGAPAGDGGNPVETIAAAGAVAIVVVAGAALVVRQRRMQARS
jgi:hypothetical protein